MPDGPAARASSNTSSERTCGSSWVAGWARISNASACRLSPASTASASPNALWTVGLPRLQIVIVHARQIVVDQRIDVDRLDRRADPQRPLGIDGEQLRGGAGQQRAQPLAAADRGMAHRLVEAVAGVAGRFEQAG